MSTLLNCLEYFQLSTVCCFSAEKVFGFPKLSSGKIANYWEIFNHVYWALYTAHKFSVKLSTFQLSTVCCLICEKVFAWFSKAFFG